jgi:hypothetical protein
MSVLVTMLLGAASARAETSIYVTEQPGLSLVFKAEDGDVYVTYLRARIICRGAGSHWEESNEATHRAFEDGPVKLHRRGGRLRLVRGSNGEFESSREVIEARVQAGRIIGSFSLHASGEGIGGSCESDASGFEPQSSAEREPPVSFAARRYVPFDSPLAGASDPAEEALYFAGSKSFEIYLRVGGEALTQVRGTAVTRCATRRGNAPSRRRSLGLDPPYPLDGEGGFDARAAYDYGFRARSARLTGMVDKEAVVGSFGILNRNRAHHRVTSQCQTGRRGGDASVPYLATRYVPAAPTARLRLAS